MNEVIRKNTPWHLWVIGIVSLLWNSFGANDYLQTQFSNLAYFEGAVERMGVSAEEALAYFQSYPAWVHGFWAIGVWGALAGSVLLLLRSRFTVWAFTLSLLGLAVTTLYQVVVPQPDWTKGGFMTVMNVIIWSIASFLMIYSAALRRKGVLR